MKRLFTFLLSLFFSAIYAEPIQANKEVQVVLDSSGLELLSDVYYQANRVKGYEHGFAVLLVQDDIPIFSKTYGYADIDTKKEFQKTTLFPAWQLKEVLITHAILQLSNRGLLEITDPVKQHLQKGHPLLGQSKNITLSHLMTRTSGFSERLLAKYSNPLLGDSLQNDERFWHLPGRQKPGVFTSSESYSSFLLQQIVEVKQGMRFKEYAADFLLLPVGMEGTYITDRLAKSQQKNLCQSYFYPSFSDKPLPVEGFRKNRSDSILYTNLRDLSYYLTSLFTDNENYLKRIVDAKIRQRMFSKQYSFAPDFPGVTFGYNESFRNAINVLYRNIYATGSSGLVFVIPEKKIAGFIYANSNNTILVENYLKKLLDTYFPVKKQTYQQKDEDDKRLQSYVGSYLSLKYYDKSISKFLSLFHSLQLHYLGAGKFQLQPAFPQLYEERFLQREYFELEPPILYNADHQSYLAFRMDNEGEITHMFRAAGDHSVYKKLASYQNYENQIYLIFAFAAYYIGVFVLLSSGFIYRYWLQYEISEMLGRLRQVQMMIYGNSLFIMVFFVAFYPVVFLLGGKTEVGVPAYMFSPSSLFYVLFSLPVLSALLLTLLIYIFLRAWAEGEVTTYRKVKYSIFILVSVCLNIWLNHWNLLGYNFP